MLSAGQDFKKDAEGKPIMVQVVNLLVTPEQAEQLSLAASQTSIQLVLRNPLDHEIAKTPGTALQHLFTGSRAAGPKLKHVAPPAPSRVPRRGAAAGAALWRPPPRRKEAPFVMEIISGHQEDGNRNSTQLREVK